MVLRKSIPFILTCLIGCDQYIDLNIPTGQSKLVLHSILVAGESPSARISKTIAPTSVYDSSSFMVTDAMVLLYQNDTLFDELIHEGQGVYISTSEKTISANKSYRIHAEAPGFDPIFTTDETVPSPVSVAKVSHAENTIANPRNSAFPTLLIEIELDETNRPIYNFGIVNSYKGVDIISSNYWFLIPYDQVDASCASSLVLGLLTIDSNCIPFDKIEIGIETLGYVQNNGRYVSVKADLTHFTIESINKAYFEYIKSSYLVEDIDLAFFEPIPLYSNVTGGYGLLVTKSILEIDIELTP